MKRRAAALFTLVVLLVSLVPVLPASAGATVPAAAAAPRIALAYSDVAHDTTMPPIAADATTPIPLNRPPGIDLYEHRLPAVETLLQSEFGTATVTRIGDRELEDASALKAFDVVVLVRQVSATGAMRQALREYVTGGGSLVCSFGTGRWDYGAQRTSQPYYPLVYLTGHSLLEWGELSETMQVGFVNDPTMIAGFHVKTHPGGASHPIVTQASAESGLASIDMTAGVSDCPELVRTFAAAGITPLLMYDEATTRLPDGTRNAVSGSLAAWASSYYLGRVVYFGFQIHDLVRGGDYASPDSQRQASRLLAEAVRWGLQDETYGPVFKGPAVSTTGGMAAAGRLRIRGKATNWGTVQLDGSMMGKLFDPRGRLVYENGVKKAWMVLAPGGDSCTLDWIVPVGAAPAKGRWTAVVYYTYWDRFRGGACFTYRIAYFTSDGKNLKYAGSPAQAPPSGALAPAGPSMAGPDRFAVAANAATTTWRSGSAAVVLATGLRPADALAAAPLAGKLDAPLLLARPDKLPPATAAAIRSISSRRATFDIWVVGSAKAVSNAVAAQAVAAARSAGARSVRLHRLAGGDDPATAAAVAGAVGAPAAGPFARTAFVVNAATYADGMSLGPIAAKHKVPVVFVTYGGVPASTQAALARLGVKHCVIFGGPGSVTPAAEDWLEARGYRVGGQADNAPGPDTRLWGATRYDVSAQTIRYAGPYAGMDMSGIGIASGEKWPDALSAGPSLGRSASPVLLVNGLDGNLTPVAMQYLMDRRGSAPRVTFFGGPATVTDFVRGQVGFVLGL